MAWSEFCGWQGCRWVKAQILDSLVFPILDLTDKPSLLETLENRIESAIGYPRQLHRGGDGHRTVELEVDQHPRFRCKQTDILVLEQLRVQFKQVSPALLALSFLCDLLVRMLHSSSSRTTGRRLVFLFGFSRNRFVHAHYTAKITCNLYMQIALISPIVPQTIAILRRVYPNYDQYRRNVVRCESSGPEGRPARPCTSSIPQCRTIS